MVDHLYPPPSSTSFGGLYRYATFQTTNYLASYMRKCDRGTLVWSTLLHEYASEPWEVEEVICMYQYIIG
jgi:hypothetical protein